MSESDRDFDNWVKALRGNASASDPVAAALREAIRADRAAEEMRLQPEVELAEQRLIARLRREGLLPEEKPISEMQGAARTHHRLFSALTRPLRKESATSIAAVAMLVFGIGIGVVNFSQHSGSLDPTLVSEEVVVRGEAMPVLVVDQPEAVAEELARQLEKLGAKTRITPINENEVILRVGVPAEAGGAAILKLLQQSGVTIDGQPPYRIRIKRRQ